MNQTLEMEAASRPWNCPLRLEMSLEVTKGMLGWTSTTCYHSHSRLQDFAKPLLHLLLSSDTASQSPLAWCPGKPLAH